MHVKPKMVSLIRIPSILLMIDLHISRNVVPLATIPKMSLTCDDKMMRATALVKPDETGPDTKSIRNPRPKRPIKSSIKPVRKDKSTAFSQLPRAV